MKKSTRAKNPARPTESIRKQILADFATLKIPIDEMTLDRHLALAEKERKTPLDLLAAVIGEQAQSRRERAIARRIKDAKFHEPCSLADFDWKFNAKTIDRAKIEGLYRCDFIRRHDNLVIIGQSGVGKSRIIQSIGHQACVLGFRVRYATSSELLTELNRSLATGALSREISKLARLDLLIIDEFGFDRLERAEAQQAASLYYKVIDARNQKRSTALVSNIDFDVWSEYLADPILAMAFLDRLVENAIPLKINGKSYRAHRSQTRQSEPTP